MLVANHTSLTSYTDAGASCAFISSYLSERILLCDTNEEVKKYEIASGDPQGSVLGPLLWNILYDGALHLPKPRGMQITGYAGDTAVTIVAKELH